MPSANLLQECPVPDPFASSLAKGWEPTTLNRPCSGAKRALNFALSVFVRQRCAPAIPASGRPGSLTLQRLWPIYLSSNCASKLAAGRSVRGPFERPSSGNGAGCLGAARGTSRFARPYEQRCAGRSARVQDERKDRSAEDIPETFQSLRRPMKES